MKHQIKGRKLGRTTSHRKATLRALATALLKYKKIQTTTAKAKELRSFVEPLITKARNNSVAARRYVAKYVDDRKIVKELFNEIIPKIANRLGGYTRVVKLGQRQGDGAEMSIIELVDYNEVEVPKKSKKAKKEKPKVEEVEHIEDFREEKKEAEEANVIEESSNDIKNETSEIRTDQETKPDTLEKKEKSDVKKADSTESEKKTKTGNLIENKQNEKIDEKDSKEDNKEKSEE